MDSRDILKELGEIRESLVDGADPEKETGSAGRRSSRPARRWILRGIGVAAAVALVILAVGKPQVEFLPGTSQPVIAPDNKDLNPEVKIVSFESFREMEEYADVIVRVTREAQETPVIVRNGENIISGFTFSQVRIDKLYKDKTDTLQNGVSIRVLENEFYDEETKTVYHVAGYSMMKVGAPYLLFLKRGGYRDGVEYYVAAGIHFGTVSLSEDGRTIGDYHEETFRPFWDEAKKKYAAD